MSGWEHEVRRSAAARRRTSSWEKAAVEAAAFAALRDPAQMARLCWGYQYKARAHHRLIAAELARLGRETSHLVITTPPQVGKSVLTSQFFPFWHLVRYPLMRVAVCSYGDDLAVRHGRATRELVKAWGGLFGRDLARGSASVQDWDLADGGGMKSVGIGGGLTGHAVNGVLILDDPHKDRHEANSRKIRDRVWDWCSSTAMSRRAPGTPVLLVGTRWHPDDLTGRLLARDGRVEEGGKWRVIHLEAIATGKRPDPLGRTAGQPLTHPRIHDEDHAALLAWWREQQQAASGFDWSALYQGDPVPPAGALLNPDLLSARRHLTDLPEVMKAAVAVDPSGDGGDTCGLVAGYLGTDRRVYVTHDRTAVMPSTEWPRAACRLAVETDADRVIVEGNFGGGMATTLIRSAWENLRREWSVDNPGQPDNPFDRLCPYLKRVTAKRGKLLRAEPVAQQIREDRLRLAGHFPDLEHQWTTWQPSDPDSPGNLDACVYLGWELLEIPGLHDAIASPVEVRIDQVQPSGWASTRIDRRTP